MTTSKNKAHEATTAAAGHSLQVCTCGWVKITSFRGLRTHQGKKGCLREQRRGPRIDQYFLRSKQSNQSIEAQRRDKNQSSQSISTPVTEENTSTEMLVEEPTQPQRPPKEGKIKGHRPGVKWPKAVEKREWESVNNDLTKLLEQQVGTADKKLERMGDIYHYREEHFGVNIRRSDKVTPTPAKSRRQQEIERLGRERRQLRKQWKKASDAEREELMLLQGDIKCRLATLRRAENLRKLCKKKEHTRTRFYKKTFKFVKDLLAKEKSRTLKISKQELEEHLEKIYHDTKRHEQLVIPHDIPPIQPPEFNLETGPPKWKEVENTVRRTRAAPGPNEVPYNLYMNAPDVLRYLWGLMRIVWQKGIILKAWRRAGGVLIPKEKDATDISQFRPICLLNVEGKIFFWAWMKIKPNKSRSISIVKGQLKDMKFCIGDDPIPTVSEQPVKSLCRWYNASLTNKDQALQVEILFTLDRGMIEVHNVKV
ncbi:hypothetical protein MHYP_G00163440 [Metynnis hypsauchen]